MSLVFVRRGRIGVLLLCMYGDEVHNSDAVLQAAPIISRSVVFLVVWPHLLSAGCVPVHTCVCRSNAVSSSPRVSRSVGTQQSRLPRLFCLPGVRQRIAPCAICRPPWLFAVAYACGSITLSDVGSMPEGGAPGSAEGTCLSLAVHGKPVGRTDILQVGGGTGPVLTARR